MVRKRIGIIAAAALLAGLMLSGGTQPTALAGSGLPGASGPARQKIHGQLSAVDATASNDVWATGCCHYGVHLLSHWNGKRWKTLDPSGVDALYDVDALPSGEVWAVGHDGVLHRVDGRWTVALTMGNTYLQAVSAITDDDVWVTGALIPPVGDSALVLHWDGKTWSEHDFPFDMGDFESVDISASSANDVWMISSRYGSVHIEHRDGAAWRDVSSPDPDFDPHNVIALSPTDTWIVGESHATAETLHWDGTQLTVAPCRPPQGISVLQDANATSATDIWAVGYTQYVGAQRALIMHWDGASWSVVQTPFTSPHRTWLKGVTTIAPDDAWAVGYREVGKGPTFQIAAHWNGVAWKRVM